MNTINSDKAWKDYGKKDPYFGVLTHDEFLDKNLSDKIKKKFFRTGDEFVKRIFENINRKIDSNFNPQRTLDFGCGTGRLTIPLAKRATHVIGIDISEDMLTEARKNAKEQNIANITFSESDDALSAVQNEKFDLINSYIVLQHINLERGYKLFKSLVDKLNDNGVGVIQFTYSNTKSKAVNLVGYFRYRISLLHGLMNLMRGNPYEKPLMQMNSYDLNEIYSILQKNGVINTYQELEDHGDFWGVTIYFQKKNSII